MVSVTIKDVASRTGLSIKTVSRVVNQDPTVKSRNRVAVQEAIEHLGYRPNIAARMLRSSRSYLLALIYCVPDSKNLAAIQSGILATCRTAGYHLLIEQLDRIPDHDRSAVSDLVERSRIDGAILMPPLSDDSDLLALLDELDVPLVRIAPSVVSHGCWSVEMDDRAATYAATTHLLKLGHRDIAFVKMSSLHPRASVRFDGYVDALASFNVPVREQWIVDGDFSVTAGIEAGKQLFARPGLPTAVLASNDDLAIGVMIEARSRGLSVPADISVMGFDDSPAAAVVSPTLSSIAQPVRRMADFAASLLVGAAVERPSLGHHVIEGFELRLRESVASPRT